VTGPQYALQFAPKAIRSLRKLDNTAVRRIRKPPRHSATIRVRLAR
jgi:hypothetical protein